MNSKYNFNHQGVEVRDAEVIITEVLNRLNMHTEVNILEPEEKDKDGNVTKEAVTETITTYPKEGSYLRYRIKMIKDGNVVPIPQQKMELIETTWDGVTELYEFALNHFRGKPEVTEIQAEPQ